MKKLLNEPYRLFFPLGTLFFFIGILLWVPLIWNPSDYPVVAHRYLMLNGFAASFIAGFLMTAVPKFSQTFPARPYEIFAFLLVTLGGFLVAWNNNDKLVMGVSALQPAIILLFLFTRVTKRKENPPYSFIFIFVGMLLWLFSGIYGFLFDPEMVKRLHYEGAIASIILGVGSRLIPGILGHVEIVNFQRQTYEKPVSLFKTVPLHFFALIIAFVGSYFLHEDWGNWVRCVVVALISLSYWKLYRLPREKTALTWCIWISGWLITLSFLIRAVWSEGMIHASHSFFINGIALLSFLIATRVLQSHGPKDKELEKSKLLYVVTGLIVFSAMTRVSAYLMPEHYLSHLGYSSIVLALGGLVWSLKYLRYVRST